MARTSHHALVTFHEPRSAFEDPAFDFETRILLGAVSQGIGDAGLVLAIVEHIHDGDAASWFNAWKAAAASLAERGAAALQAGHPRRAQWAYLTASEYYAKALVAVDGLPDDSVLTPTFAAQQLMWEAYVDASDGRFVPLDVPYEDTTLPGYLLRPDTSGRVRPTLVLTNGSDGVAGRPGRLRRRRGAGPGLERLPLRRTRAAIDAVPAWRPVPAGLGGGAHVGCTGRTGPGQVPLSVGPRP